MESETPERANGRALDLRAHGDLAGALCVFEEAVARFPYEWTLHVNRAFVLAESGRTDAALRSYDAAIALQPAALEAHVAKGFLLFGATRNDEALSAFRAALAIDPYETRANLALYELMHVRGDLLAAREHQARALERQRLFSAIAPEQRRSVLVLCAPGDLQANVPVDFLFDTRTTTVHKLYLLDAERLAAQPLPAYDVVFNAIAESPDAGPALALAERFLRGAAAPAINPPANVLRTERTALAAALRDVPCRVAPIVRVRREDVDPEHPPLAFPLIVRPVGSHAGHGLEKIDDPAALRDYLVTAADELFVSAFIDYRSADGLYRKYRIICVDGEPYPCHLAISPRWMIHYYNAPMAENAWMREEEARFLARFDDVFGPAQREALRRLAAALELEYVGIDCTLDRDGNVLVFEADPAMIVHVSDPVETYGYKHEHVPRIFRAVEAMLDARIGTAAR